MYIGTPRAMRHAAAWRENPELTGHQPAAHRAAVEDPVERVLVVEEPAIPDHVGEFDAEPNPAEIDADLGQAVPDDPRALTGELDEEQFLG